VGADKQDMLTKFRGLEWKGNRGRPVVGQR
jgi:hypothetical protein